VILLLLILLVVFASVAPPWSIVLILLACLLEAVEIVLLRRWSKRLDRRTKRTTGAEAMIGQPAEVMEACRPNGTVQLRGELWEARCEEGAETGETVRVESVEGLTLVVAR
jgi:membrane-bound serine protease (ClpP class)